MLGSLIKFVFVSGVTADYMLFLHIFLKIVPIKWNHSQKIWWKQNRINSKLKIKILELISASERNHLSINESYYSSII